MRSSGHRSVEIRHRLLRRPLLDDHFHQHPSVWNRDTTVGAALFGVGWGLGAGNWDLLWALAGIALGAPLKAATRESKMLAPCLCIVAQYERMTQ